MRRLRLALLVDGSVSEQVDGADELRGLEWLAEMHLESGGERVLPMLLARKRRDGGGGNG